MRFARRIIPVSSGKGGVGKTTFALNYALSLAAHGRTVLVDLDTGTSSVRHSLRTPVTHDLYHFFKKGRRLADCVTGLDARLDPQGRFRNFGFVAGPRQMMDELTNFDRQGRERLIEGINELEAAFVILDLKAGLDANVISFLPFSNTGVLVFTPQLPAASLAAADIVKSVLFRKLRGLFAEGSRLYTGLDGVTPGFVNTLLDRAEDAYAPGAGNLDAFVDRLRESLGPHPVVRLVSDAVGSFVVHFVLNCFNGVNETYSAALRPFLDRLTSQVSARLDVVNLGWVIAHDALHQGNVKGVPALLRPPATGGAVAAPDARLRQLALQYLDRAAPATRAPRAAAAPGRSPDARPSRYLEAQLEGLRSMHSDLGTAGYHENFRYITHRSLHVLSSRRIADFGGTRIYKDADLLHAFRAAPGATPYQTGRAVDPGSS